MSGKDIEAARILVVDDEEDFRSVVVEHLQDLGHHTSSVGNGESALRITQEIELDLALVDLRMPGMDGVELLSALKKLDPGIEVIVITGHATVDTALRAMKQGAFDYLLKPCRLAELEAVVQGALEKRRLRQEGERLREQIRRSTPETNLVGVSPQMGELRSLIEQVAPTDATVLILGETGSGKEVVARSLHNQSRRAGESLVAMHAGAIPDGLVESELFGHVRGAFTGATAPRRGLLELADGGTLFIDEIGEMPLPAQVKLLRVLETSTFRPVGGEKERGVKVRFVAATHRDLRARSREGSFREDLFFRLNVFSIPVPPLRERLEDIPPLVEHYLGRSRARARLSLRPEVYEALKSYSWPGNIRELFNVLERAVILARDEIGLEHLPTEIKTPRTRRPAAKEEPEQIDWRLESVVREHIASALHHTGGNKVDAARLLEIPRRTLYRRLERYGLADEDW